MKNKNKWLVLAGLLGLIGLLAAFALNRGSQVQHFTAKVERGEINDVVEATGTINAVITVQVGSQVSGTIAKLNVDFNSRVHKGDIVALIDPALFQEALLQATADWEKAKAGGVQAKADYDRTVALSKEGVMSQQQLDLAKANFDSATAAINGAIANVTQAEAQVTQKAAAVTVAQPH